MNNKVDEIWVRDQQEQELQICGAFEMVDQKNFPKCSHTSHLEDIKNHPKSPH